MRVFEVAKDLSVPAEGLVQLLREMDIEVIADLCHFGVPNWLGGFQDRCHCSIPFIHNGWAGGKITRRARPIANKIVFHKKFSKLRSQLLIFRCEKPNQNVDSRDFNTEAVRVYVIPKSDPCDEPLEIARTRIVIRSTPFSVIKACVKADQMKPHPRLDAKTAQAFLD